MSYKIDVKKKLDAALAEMDVLHNVLGIIKSGAYNAATEKNTQTFPSLLDAIGATVQSLDYIQIVNDTDTTLNGFWLNNSDDAQVIDSDIADPTSNLIKVSDYIGSFNLTTFITNFKALHGDLNNDDLVDANDVREFYKGATGIQGEQGIQGLVGNTGIDGLTGDQGDTGDTGATPVQFITIVQTYVDGTFTYTVNALYPATQIVTLEVLKNGVIDFTAVVLNPGRLAHSFDYSPLSQSDNGAAITTAIAFSNASVSHSTLPSGTVAHPQDNPVTATVSYNAELSDIDIVLDTVATEDIAFDIVEVVSGTNWSDTYPALTVTIPKGSLLGTIMQDVEGILLNDVNATTELQILNRYVALTDLTLVGNAGMFIDTAVNVDYTSTFNSDPGQSSQYDLSFKTTLLNSVPSVTNVGVVDSGLTIQKLDQIQPGDTVSNITFTEAELAALQGETLSILVSSDDSNIIYHITPSGSSNASYTVLATSTITTYPDYVNSLNPLAHYRLGDSSGTVVVDETGNYDGTYVNSPTLGATGLLVNDSDTAVEFDGVDQYVSAPVIAGVKSVNMIVTLDDIDAGDTNFQGLFSQGTSNPSRAYFYIRGGSFRVTINTSPLYAFNFTLDIATTYHITLVERGADLELWVDGILEDTYTGSTFFKASDTFQIGTYFNNDFTSRTFDGTIDEVALFGTALTDGQIKTLYTASKTDLTTLVTPTTGTTFIDYAASLNPVAYYRLGETSGTIAVDETGNHHGTYVGSPTLGANGLLVNDNDTAVGISSGDEIHSNVGVPASGFSVSFLVKIDTHIPNGTPVALQAANTYKCLPLILTLSGGYRSYIVTTTGTTSYQIPVTFNLGETYHIVSTAEQGFYKVWVNGTKVISEVITGDLVATDNLLVNGWNNTNHVFDGTLDEVVLFDTVLTEEEILTLYTLARINSAKYLSYDDLVAGSGSLQYKLGEASGNFIDSIGSNDGIVFAGSSVTRSQPSLYPIGSDDSILGTGAGHLVSTNPLDAGIKALSFFTTATWVSNGSTKYIMTVGGASDRVGYNTLTQEWRLVSINGASTENFAHTQATSPQFVVFASTGTGSTDIYIDGTLIHTSPQDIPDRFSSNAIRLLQGVTDTYVPQRWEGGLDDFVAHTSLLSEEDIKTLYIASKIDLTALATPAVSTPTTFNDYANSLSPTSYYRLGESSGTTFTDSVAGNDATFIAANGFPVLGVTGLLVNDTDTAAEFASNGGIPTIVTPVVVSGDSSIHFLFSTSKANQSRKLLSTAYTSGRIAIQLGNGKIGISHTNNNNYTSNYTVPLNQVISVVANIINDVMTIYVDGVLVFTSPGTFTKKFDLKYIGSGNYVGSQIQGVIDEVFTLDRVITEEERSKLHILARIDNADYLSYNAHINSLNPIAHYRLGETSGTIAVDETGNYNGTHVGILTLGEPSLVASESNDSSVYFDGSNKYINLPDMGLTGSSITTIVGLFKVGTKNSGYGTIIDFATQCGGRRIDLLYGASTVTMNAYNNATICSHVLNVDETYHFAVIFDPVAGQAEIFINGQSVSSGVMGDTTPYGTKFALGGHIQNNYYTKGTLDEVAIFDTALTDGQIKTLYAASKTDLTTL